MFNLKHKVMPISNFETKYRELLQKIRSGVKLNGEDWEFIHHLTRKNLLVVLEMFNNYNSLPTTLSTN